METAFGEADVDEPGLSVAAPRIALVSDLLGVNEGDEAERRRLPIPAGGGDGLQNQFGRETSPFVSKQGVDPRPPPAMSGVFRVGPTRHPQGALTPEHDATPRRDELRGANLLAVVVPVGDGESEFVGARTKSPAHLVRLVEDQDW